MGVFQKMADSVSNAVNPPPAHYYPHVQAPDAPQTQYDEHGRPLHYSERYQERAEDRQAEHIGGTHQPPAVEDKMEYARHDAKQWEDGHKEQHEAVKRAEQDVRAVQDQR